MENSIISPVSWSPYFQSLWSSTVQNPCYRPQKSHNHTGFVASGLTGFADTFLPATLNELGWLDFQKTPPCICLKQYITTLTFVSFWTRNFVFISLTFSTVFVLVKVDVNENFEILINGCNRLHFCNLY